MGNSNKLDFTGQPIYIGLDVHKKSWSVSIHSALCEHKTFTQCPDGGYSGKLSAKKLSGCVVPCSL